MAIKVNLTTNPIGQPLENAYCKINIFMGDKNQITIQKYWYTDETARKSGAKPLWEEKQELPVGDVMEYLYEQIKKKYTGAEDC